MYQTVNKLGEGTFGEVYKGVRTDTGEVVAMKKIRIRKYQDGIPKAVFREIQAMQLLDHENLLKCYDVYAEGSSIVLVLELMRSDLYHLLKNASYPIPESVIKRIALMMFHGIAEMHDKNVIHRDLKPSNMLLSFNGTLKIGDFGLAKVFMNDLPSSHQVATRWYRSPESLFGGRLDSPAGDCWSAGCILAEMSSLCPLFGGENDIDQLYRIFHQVGTVDKHRFPWPEVSELPDFHKIVFPSLEPISLLETLPDAPPKLVGLCEKLLVLPPNKRITAREALLDDWFFTPPLAAPIESILPLLSNNIPKRESVSKVLDINFEFQTYDTLQKHLVKMHFV